MNCSHCNQFDACNDLTRKEDDMYALVELTCQAKKISIRDIFRVAYQWKFNKDIPYECLEQDIETFKQTFNTPPYVCDYLIATYGPV